MFDGISGMIRRDKKSFAVTQLNVFPSSHWIVADLCTQVWSAALLVYWLFQLWCHFKFALKCYAAHASGMDWVTYAFTGRCRYFLGLGFRSVCVPALKVPLPDAKLLFHPFINVHSPLTSSGLGCSTVLSPDSAAQHAVQILGLSDHLVWAKLRASMLNTWISLKQADQKLQQCNIWTLSTSVYPEPFQLFNHSIKHYCIQHLLSERFEACDLITNLINLVCRWD